MTTCLHSARMARRQRLRRLGVSLALAAVTVMGLGACGSSSDDNASTTASASKEPIVIGGALALSGFVEPYDVEPLNGFKLLAREINARGGIDGRQIKIVTADTQSKPSNGPIAAQQVLSDGADIVLVTCDYDYGSPAAITAVGAGKLAFSECAGSPKFGPAGVGEFAFTMGTPVQTDAATGAEFAYTEKGLRKAFILTDDTTEYQRAWATGFAYTFKALGGEVVGTSKFKNGDASIASQVAAIKSSGADVVGMPTYLPGGSSAVRQIRSGGIDVPIILNTGMETPSWIKSIPGLSDVYVTSYASPHGDDSDPTVNKITEQYAAAYGRAPETSFAYMGYGLAQVLQKAIEATGTTDAAKLTDYLETMPALPTAVGNAEFSRDLHITVERTLNINEIQDGRSAFLKKIQATNIQTPEP